MNKFTLVIIFLLFPVACFAQAKFSLSCENVTKIHIGQFETKYWPVESEDGYFYILLAELTEDAGEKLMALDKATPYSYSPKKDGVVSKFKDIAIITQGKKIKSAMPKWDFLSKEGVGVPIILKDETFIVAHDICPDLVPETVRTDKKFD